jgi:type IV secretion system protein VirB11
MTKTNYHGAKCRIMISSPIFVKPGVVGLLTPLMSWLSDTRVSEIMINMPRAVFIERFGVMSRFDVPELTPLYLQRLFQFIANESNQRLDEFNPTLSGNLFDGSRVQLVIPPVSLHHTLSIRRASIARMNLQDYDAQGFYEQVKGVHMTNEAILTDTDAQLKRLYQQGRWGEFISLAIAFRKTIVVSGGTSSGKTTYLNACLQAIDLNERLILLEDTRELVAPHPNQIALLAFRGDQGRASVSMQDLVQCSLRLRPDRLIMGEIRGPEIMDFVAACATGHAGSFTSIHANNPHLAMQRMIQLYKQNNVPSMRDEEIRAELNSVIDIILQVSKTDKGRMATHCYYKACDDGFVSV